MRAAWALIAGAALGCAAPGVPVEAAVGATVSSEDGVLTLILPPGALPRDVSLSIERLDEADWPVAAPGRFTLPAPVYRIEPELELTGDAYVVFHPTAPERLRAAGGDVLAASYTWGTRDEKVRPASATRTVALADGRVVVVATLYELGVLWIGERVPGADRALTQLSLQIDADLAGEHARDEPFAVSAASLTSDADHALFGREVWSAAAGPAGGLVVAPVEWTGGRARTWGATYDPERLVHPLEVFGGPAPREERVAVLADPAPVDLGPGAPLAPISDPLPGWRCATAGEGATVFVGVDVVTGASEGVATVGAARELTVGPCR